MDIDELMKSWGTFLSLYTNNSTFRHNIELLSKMPLEYLGQNVSCETVKNVTDLYRRGELEGTAWTPVILDKEGTLDSLLANPKSFCRFGDGEIQIMMGNSIPFQVYDQTMAEKMLAILHSVSDLCMVGIPSLYYVWPYGVTDFAKDWLLKNRMLFVSFLDEHLSRSRKYIDTGFTCGYIGSGETYDNLEGHYEKKMKLFEERKIVIFAGENILAGLSYNIFERAKSIEIVNCPKENAFSVYDQILAKARTYDKDEYIICLILGPTATVAAWDLAQEGYLAWDIGHMAKDYDAWRRKLGNSQADNEKFFAPD